MGRKVNVGRLYEIGLEQFSDKTISRLVNAGNTYDPTFEAACALEEGNDAYADSTAINKFWEMADYWGSQFIVYKRKKDKEDTEWNGGLRDLKKLGRRREKRKDGSGCSALLRDRKRCALPAVYILARKSKSGYWSYQRRCEKCFEKVKCKEKYAPIKDGRYF
jgi:hypothetical protein